MPAELATRPPAPAPVSALLPAPWPVRVRRVESADVVTLVLEAPPGAAVARPGQFNMVTAFGVGEIPVSVSGTEARGRLVRHTIRDVGAVSHALVETAAGALVGVRGPYGTDWGVEEARGDVVVVAGGIGVAPLRGAITALCERAGEGVRVFVAIGAREPDQVLFPTDLRRWQQNGAAVAVAVDTAEPGWTGSVGLVTSVLPELGFEPSLASALVCGPEVMIRFVARALIRRGVPASRIRVSLERNMQCGVGLCGHCQLGPFLLCRDGPVVAYERVARLLMERER